MSTRISTDSCRPERFVCADLRGVETGPHDVNARHTGILGYDNAKASSGKVLICGAGGLGGEISEGGVRKGWGEIEILDGQRVELSNLNRQKFTRSDIGKNKAICLARNLQAEGYMGSIITGTPFFFQDAVALRYRLDGDIIICGVDNDETRTFVARFGLSNRIPVIFTAVSRDADHGYVFIQEPGGPCFGCLRPEAITNEIHPCPGIPAVKDILKIVAGTVLYAVDSLLMERPRSWNYRDFHLAGFMPDVSSMVTKRNDCSLCAESAGASRETI